jgi:zona occludens toxin (predicted ATPase)
MVVIDEMHKYFNSRDWQKEENRQCADWCSTHRHEGYDALFLTQRIEKVDTQVRGLTEWTYRYKKVNFLGSFVNKSYVCIAYSGDDTHTPMTKIVRRYDKKIFACYKSYVTKDTRELGIQKHANILKHPIFFMIPLAIIATIYFGARSVSSSSSFISTVKNSAFVTDSKEAKKDGQVKKAVSAAAVHDKNDNIKSLVEKYSLIGVMAEWVVVEDRTNGNQKPLFDVIGKYTIIDSKRNEFVTVSAASGIYTFSVSGRYIPAAKEQAASSLALAAGKTTVK